MFRKIVPSAGLAGCEQVQAAQTVAGRFYPRIIRVGPSLLPVRVEDFGAKSLLTEATPRDWAPTEAPTSRVVESEPGDRWDGLA